MDQLPSSQQLLHVDQSSQHLLAQAEAALEAAAQLSAQPSDSLSEASSSSSGMGSLDHSLLSMLSELLQAARAAGISSGDDQLPEDLQQQLQQVLLALAANAQTEAAGAQAAAGQQAFSPSTVSARGHRLTRPQLQQDMSITYYSAVWEPEDAGVPTWDAASQGSQVTLDAAAQTQDLTAGQVRG